ncbi:hypothetical protein AOLI_G00072530 [Acnodon oligacanthus]
MLAEPTLIAPEPTLLKKGHRFKRDLTEIVGEGVYIDAIGILYNSVDPQPGNQIDRELRVGPNGVTASIGGGEYGPYDTDNKPDLDLKPDYLGDDLPHYPDSDEDDSTG